MFTYVVYVKKYVNIFTELRELKLGYTDYIIIYFQAIFFL